MMLKRSGREKELVESLAEKNLPTKGCTERNGERKKSSGQKKNVSKRAKTAQLLQRGVQKQVGEIGMLLRPAQLNDDDDDDDYDDDEHEHGSSDLISTHFLCDVLQEFNETYYNESVAVPNNCPWKTLTHTASLDPLGNVLDAVNYYAEHYGKIMEVTDELDSTDSSTVAAVK
ncbi:hypothetical protein ANN_09264 [Periplaneta americana]|uniref:Uncharacterized protein n=1 Tax=Periplaneta americana TaxID=6978 RepID=A0ABQ8TND2_PERAM|nr:hypothetical protein ANN_09264 [Periplaneta americana]